jgi:hypothetical protein
MEMVDRREHQKAVNQVAPCGSTRGFSIFPGGSPEIEQNLKPIEVMQESCVHLQASRVNPPGQGGSRGITWASSQELSKSWLVSLDCHPRWRAGTFSLANAARKSGGCDPLPGSRLLGEEGCTRHHQSPHGSWKLRINPMTFHLDTILANLQRGSLWQTWREGAQICQVLSKSEHNALKERDVNRTQNVPLDGIYT